MTNDLRTPREKERTLKHKQICSLFQSLRRTHPDATASRLFDAVATEVGYTTVGVRKVIIANGLYKSRR